MTVQPFQLLRIRNCEQLAPYQNALEHLLQANTAFLHDDHQQPTLAEMLENLTDSIPYLWLVIHPNKPVDKQVWVGSSLTDVVPNRHAFLHGVSVPEARKTGAIELASFAALDTAFDELKVAKLKAEVPHTHHGARGFCQNYQFQCEATFHQDIRINGLWHDVSVYTLLAPTYYQTVRRSLAHVIWKKEETWCKRPQDNPHHQNHLQLTTG